VNIIERKKIKALASDFVVEQEQAFALWLSEA
jgi:hypothetical protein